MISFGAQVGLAPGAGGGRALGLGGILAFSGETGEVGKGGPLVEMAELVDSLGFWRGAAPGPPVFPLLDGFDDLLLTLIEANGPTDSWHRDGRQISALKDMSRLTTAALQAAHR